MKNNLAGMHIPNPLNTVYQSLIHFFHKKNVLNMFVTFNSPQAKPLPIPGSAFSNDPAVAPSYNYSPLFDLGLLEEMDDNEYMAEILSIFLTETPVDLAEMLAATKSDNAYILYSKAHKIKGSAGLMQANAFLNLLVVIEDNAKANRVGPALTELVESAHEAYKSLGIALEQRLKMIKDQKSV
jgi:HPt (histidine-containing phosphotransfer) domain-containing protein